MTHRLIALLVITAAFFTGAHTVVEGFGIYPPGATGYDISYPQCQGTFPSDQPGFAIIGVNGGRAFYQNPCLVTEYAWAQTSPVPPSFFMNLNAPSGKTAFKGRTGPRGACRPEDDNCIAYNFGYNAARLAFADAQSQETSAGMWWLDIETENTWSDNTALNVLVIQGALDYLRAQRLTLGVYSTPKQWGDIMGTFSPGLPNWVAGAPDAAGAPDYCAPSHAFGGGTVWLVQYPSGDFDANYACPTQPLVPPITPGGPIGTPLPTPAPIPLLPPAPTGIRVTAVNPTAVQITWASPGGPVDSYIITDGTTQTTIRAPVTAFAISGLAPGSYHCYSILAVAGSVYSAWSSWICVTTPLR